MIFIYIRQRFSVCEYGYDLFKQLCVIPAFLDPFIIFLKAVWYLERVPIGLAHVFSANFAADFVEFS